MLTSAPVIVLSSTWARNLGMASQMVAPSASSIHGTPLNPPPFLVKANRFRADCKASVEGFPGNKYKGFNTQAEAMSYIAGYTLASERQTGLEEKGAAERATTKPTSTDLGRVVGTRSYARMESCADLTEGDFEGRQTQEASFWNERNRFLREKDSNLSPPKKRISPDPLSSSGKRAKLNDNEIEVIDLTDSPPKQSREPKYSSLHPSKPKTAVQDASSYSQLLTDLFTSTTLKKGPPAITKTFTMDDCSPEQRHILDLVSQGKNVFFTGSAGVGKSFVLQKICQLFESQGRKQFVNFFITASTGTCSFVEVLM